VNPLSVCTTIGALLSYDDSAGLSVYRRYGTGPWIASWAKNLRGDLVAYASASSPDAAIEALADALVDKARVEADRLAHGDADDQALAHAIVLTIATAEEARAA